MSRVDFLIVLYKKATAAQFRPSILTGPLMNRQCAISGELFTVNPKETHFCDSRGFPLPTLSPRERIRRRLSFRNNRHLFHRRCDATGQMLVSMYSPAYPGRIVSPEHWRSDQVNSLDIGRDFDFSRAFFPQFQELMHDTPLPSAAVVNSENCDYNSYCAMSKSCYLCQSVIESENVYYTFGATRVRDCLDCHNVDDSELCFEVLYGTNCYNVRFSKNVVHCRDSAFLLNCRSCSNCLFCTNLRSASYCVRNQQVTKAEYERELDRLNALGRDELFTALAEFYALAETQIAPSVWGAMNENASGNYLFQCRNIINGFDLNECEDIVNGYRLRQAKDCCNLSYLYQGENLYETMSGSRFSHSAFSFAAFDGCSFLQYSAFCTASSNLFGCVGLQRASNCVFNRQYTERDFKTLREKIIAHMRETGEWGEFFPAALSPFGYNQSAAQDIAPLTKEEVLKRGLAWAEGELSSTPSRPGSAQRSAAGAVDPDTTYSCRTCSRHFKIQASELELGRKMGAPPADQCFFCRAESRLTRCD